MLRVDNLADIGVPDPSRHGSRERRRGKYRNARCEVDGIGFDSRLEANRYAQLKVLEKACRIENLELQKRYPLEVNGVLVGHYVADFVYTDINGSLVVEDAKGVKTRVYMLKKKLMFAIYGITIVEFFADNDNGQSDRCNRG